MRSATTRPGGRDPQASPHAGQGNVAEDYVEKLHVMWLLFFALLLSLLIANDNHGSVLFMKVSVSRLLQTGTCFPLPCVCAA